ncbi:MAG TPA: nucleotidyl transferase AbiEii/AbiGii toxin family protein [Polyangiaceae bacterium]|jgi:hypothetical protein|nr:nucleotidyl transferase AbiEii/AbiGii toxin family protein [Polyangiaceae bacterium]
MAEELPLVAELFARAGVDYAVIGGHAVNAWLEPRFTADIDVTVVASDAEMKRLNDVFAAAGFHVSVEHGADQPSGPDFVRLTTGDGSVVVELQVAKTALQFLVVSRARSARSGARVATPEDLLILKLIAHRAKDRIDLEGLARIPSIDWSYVEHQSREWDVLDRLEELRRGIPLP